jgi:hypothetical protein
MIGFDCSVTMFNWSPILHCPIVHVHGFGCENKLHTFFGCMVISFFFLTPITSVPMFLLRQKLWFVMSLVQPRRISTDTYSYHINHFSCGQPHYIFLPYQSLQLWTTPLHIPPISITSALDNPTAAGTTSAIRVFRKVRKTPKPWFWSKARWD